MQFKTFSCLFILLLRLYLAQSRGSAIMGYEQLYHARAWKRVKPDCDIPFVLTNLSWEDLSIIWGVFNRSIIPLALAGYEMIIAN